MPAPAVFSTRKPTLPEPLAAVIATGYPGQPEAPKLYSSFLRKRNYDASFVHRTIEAVRKGEWSWELRCAAILMLENQLLLPGACDFMAALSALGVLQGTTVHARVLEEGFTTTDPSAFMAQLRARMSRLDRVQRALRGLKTTPDALLDFIYVSRRECKLTLARYLFTVEEVAARIRGAVRRTDGLPKELDAPDPERRELERACGERICEFDRQLAARLRDGHGILWVSERTPSEINALVEYPLNTVALVIKPPGSDLEFEIKRAGMRGDHALDVVFERDGRQVPPFHRLQGASSGSMLDFESWAGQRFRTIYRGAHGAEPPMSRTLGVTSISAVPSQSGPVHLMEYFSYPWSFGPDFERMQTSLRQSVESYEGEQPREDLPGAVGWTVRFLTRTLPNQAWLAETTSFRLDRTAELLSARGPELYFGQGLKRSYTPMDARRFADELLEEVLGVFQPPDPAPVDYVEYVSAALARQPNRSVADAAYLRSLGDIGLYWGTLLAFGGYTEGESFVTRNVGLKSRWRRGEWGAGICFMDHDCLRAVGAPNDWPHPSSAIEGMRKDHDWIRGEDCEQSEFACLRGIYRVSPECERAGEQVFLKNVAEGYHATRNAMKNLAAVRSLFDPNYVRTLDLRDEAIRLYLISVRASESEETLNQWRQQARIVMAPSVYPADWIPGMCDAIVRNRRTLERFSVLYGA